MFFHPNETRVALQVSVNHSDFFLVTIGIIFIIQLFQEVICEMF